MAKIRKASNKQPKGVNFNKGKKQFVKEVTNKEINALKKFIKDNKVLKNNEDFEKSTQKENEPSLLEKALKSPLVGTAYLSPDPGAKKFVEVGQNVKIGQVLLIIEAMKTMNEITADKNGVIKKIFVKNESPVEFGEPLFLID